MKQFLLVFCLFMLTAQNSIAGEIGTYQYDDPRIKKWNALLIAGKPDDLLTSLEADLRSAKPHSQAGAIWTQLQSKSDRLSEAVEGLKKDPALAVALGKMPQMRLLIMQHDYQRLFSEYSLANLVDERNPWVFIELAWAAEAGDDLLLKAQYLLRAAELYPVNANVLWMLLETATQQNDARQMVTQAIAANGPLAKTPAGAFSRQFLPLQRQQLVDWQVAFARWETEHPDDVSVHQVMAHLYYEREMFEDAAEAYLRYVGGFPLYNSPRPVSQMLTRVERYAEADRWIQLMSAGPRASQAKNEARANKYRAEAAVNSGWLGRAREIIAASGKNSELDADMAGVLAGIEGRRRSRAGHAVDWYQYALAKNATEPSLLDGLLEALKDTKRVRPALEMCEKHSGSPGARSVGFYTKCADMFREAGDNGSAQRFVDEGAVLFPKSRRLRLAQAEVFLKEGRTDEVKRITYALIDERPANSWSAVSMLAELTPEGERLALAEDLAKKYPYALSNVLKPALSKVAKEADKVALADKLGGAFPDDTKLLRYQMSFLESQKNYREALESYQRRLTAPQPLTLSDKHGLFLDIGWIYEKLNESDRLSDEETADFQDVLQQWAAFDKGSLRYLWLKGFSLWVGDELSAAKAFFEKHARLDPTDFEYGVMLLQESALRDDTGKVGGFLARRVERDPYNGEVLANSADLAIYYVGAPITGLQYLQWVKERDPDAFSEKSEAKALAQLGVSDALARSYQQSSSIGRSERYINWFADSRQKALSGESGSLSFTAPFEVKIVRPDGSELVLREHSRSGKMEYARLGAAFYEATYSADGSELQSIRNSLDKEISLQYDSQKNITRLAQKGGDELRMEYNALGKPVLIEIAGVGEIRVVYDADGEIVSVDSPQGEEMVPRVTDMMSSLLELTRGINAHGVERLLREGRDDELAGQLRVAYDESQGGLDRAKKGVALADRLIQVVGMNQSYPQEAEEILDETRTEAVLNKGAEWKNLGMTAIGLQHKLSTAVNPAGMDQDRYREVLRLESRLSTLLAQGGNKKTFDQVTLAMREQPAKLRQNARWMPVSDFVNPGYWRAYSRGDLLPTRFASARLQSVLPLVNGDLVIGSESGFSVNHAGIWHWYGLPTGAGRMTDTVEAFEAGAHNNIKTLAQTSDGALWLGTGNGVYRLTELDAPTSLWRTPKEGLPTPMVLQLWPDGTSVMVLTEKAVTSIIPTSRESRVIDIPDGASAVAATVIPAKRATDGANFAVATNKGVYLLSAGQWKKVFDKAAQDVHAVAASSGAGRLFVLSGNQVFEVPQDGGSPQLVPGHHEIVHGGAIRGLSSFTDGQSTNGLSIHTDSGLSVLKDGVIEHARLDFGLVDRTVDVRKVATRENSFYILTDSDVMLFEKNNVRHISGPTERIRVHDKSNTTYFLQEGQLKQVKDQQVELAYRAHVNSFDVAADGDLVLNDAQKILRVAAKDGKVIPLFNAVATMKKSDDDDSLTAERVKDVLVAKSGEVWVLTSRAVFRHRDGQTSEFGWYLDNGSFPFASDMLYRLQELADGKIGVIASSEEHRLFQGRKLDGGLAVFDGQRFVASETKDMPWFITSYTPIQSGKAIVGTNSGFAEFQSQKIRPLTESGNRSYALLKQKQPALFLGTRGAKLGDETYLFGSAGGLVGWYRGEWFSADRLNRLLPGDAKFGNRGGRTIHDVAVDKVGRIYVGTDLGLLIYSGSDAEGVAFLRTNHSPDAALVATEEQKRLDEKERYLKSIPEGSVAAQLKNELLQLKTEIARLNGVIEDPVVGSVSLRKNGQKDEAKTVAGQQPAVPDPKKQLRQREREVQKLMAKIQAEDPALHMMLELKPFDLQAVRSKLQDGDLVLQPIPLRNSLILHVVTRDGFDAREIQGVSREQLFARASRLQELLDQAAKGEIGRKVIRIPQSGEVVPVSAAKSRAEIAELLDWFYGILFFPAEKELARSTRLIFSGTGALNFLPIAAVSKNSLGERKHLIEVFPNLALTNAPSLYVFQLSPRVSAGDQDVAVVVGNPTGDLAQAEVEAKNVSQTLGDGVVSLLGSQATKKAFLESLDGARWLHLAMHGQLDDADPYASALIFAGKEKLTLLDIMALPLDSVESAVLSACESGKGQTGNEYTTLAWSFANAGVPTVLATLWSVQDEATRALMGTYYRELTKGVSPQIALAESQRAMLAKYRNNPESWSAFVAFGK